MSFLIEGPTSGLSHRRDLTKHHLLIISDLFLTDLSCVKTQLHSSTSWVSLPNKNIMPLQRVKADNIDMIKAAVLLKLVFKYKGACPSYTNNLQGVGMT